MKKDEIGRGIVDDFKVFYGERSHRCGDDKEGLPDTVTFASDGIGKVGAREGEFDRYKPHIVHLKGVIAEGRRGTPNPPDDHLSMNMFEKSGCIE